MKERRWVHWLEPGTNTIKFGELSGRIGKSEMLYVHTGEEAYSIHPSWVCDEDGTKARVIGVSRDAENGRTLCVAFDRVVTDHDMRAFHEFARGFALTQCPPQTRVEERKNG